MAEHLPSPSLIMAAWLAGGFLTMAGALTFAELGAALPDGGGPYVYLREGYGPFPAFLFGWITLLVYQPGVTAAVAMRFASYLGYFAPALGSSSAWELFEVSSAVVSVSAPQLVAAFLILRLTAINVRGLRAGTRVQNLFTFLKVAAIGVFALKGVTQ